MPNTQFSMINETIKQKKAASGSLLFLLSIDRRLFVFVESFLIVFVVEEAQLHVLLNECLELF